MAYNYDRDLVLHEDSQEILRRLEQVALTGKPAVSYFTDPQEMARSRYLLNNLLANVALYFPDRYEKLRKSIRTWAIYNQTDNIWELYVGIPSGKIAGAPPGATSVRVLQRVLDLPNTSEVYEHPNLIPLNRAGWDRMIGLAIEMKDKEVFKELLFDLEAPMPQGQDKVIAAFTEVGWRAEFDTPTRLHLYRA